MVYECILTVQICIAGLLHHARLDCFCNTFPHLCGCRFRECHDKQAVDIHRVFLIQHLLYDTLYEHCCLATAGCRRDEQVTAPQVNDLLLLLGPCYTHRQPSSFL